MLFFNDGHTNREFVIQVIMSMMYLLILATGFCSNSQNEPIFCYRKKKIMWNIFIKKYVINISKNFLTLQYFFKSKFNERWSFWVKVHCCITVFSFLDCDNFQVIFPGNILAFGDKFFVQDNLQIVKINIFPVICDTSCFLIMFHPVFNKIWNIMSHFDDILSV